MNQIPAIIAWSPIIVYFAPVEGRLCFSSVAPTSIIFLVQQIWDECGVASRGGGAGHNAETPIYNLHLEFFGSLDFCKC